MAADRTQDDQRLVSLWQQRAQLDKAGWTELYLLVQRILTQACRAPELERLPDSREDYIQMFWTDKVYRLDKSCPHHAGALCVWFRNMLKDVLKLSATRYEQIGREDDWFSSSAAPLDVAAEDDEHPASAESGRLVQAAATFFAQLAPEEQLYLALSFCPDEEDALALSTLAARHKIASYHYKAEKLGITHSKQRIAADYGNTKIGRWMTETLGITLSGNQHAEMLHALKILCHHALTWHSRQQMPHVTP